jgi:RIO kinase 1
MTDPLAPLLLDGVIDEVVTRLKSGKEADVWLVRQGGEVVAAKVYKARHTRSFKNNAAYMEGRQVRNTRTQRAMDRGSRFGQEAAEDAWKAKESDALHRLHAAGVRVPRPVLFFEGVLLMEVVVDADGHPAPRLVDAQVPPGQAAAMYADLRRQAVGMLACDLIHGDLSPYNILVGANGPVIIDFPQVVGAAHNSQAEGFFLRDLHNVHRFFAALDPALAASEGDGREIWRAYVRRELTPDFVPTGKAPEPHRHRDQGARRDAPRPPHGQGRQHPQPRQGQGQGQGAPRGRGQPHAPPREHGAQRPPQHGGKPGRAPQGQNQPSPARGGPRPERRGTMPEVVKVVRLDRSAQGAGGPGAAPARGAGPERGRDQGRHGHAGHARGHGGAGGSGGRGHGGHGGGGHGHGGHGGHGGGGHGPHGHR